MFDQPDKKPVLVISHAHHLLPFAYRLTREDFDVEVAIVHVPSRYEEAWKGKFKSFLPTKKSSDTQASMEYVRRGAEESGALVVTDSVKWTKAFDGYDKLFGALPRNEKAPTVPFAVGAWFDGEGLMQPHWLARDIGAWSGSQGPAVVSGLTLIDGAGVGEYLLQPLLAEFPLEQMKEAGFKGLVSMDLSINIENGKGRFVGSDSWTAGWPMFHTHAFLSDIPSFGGLLSGYAQILPHRFTVVGAVSVPPWPNKSNSFARPDLLVREAGVPDGQLQSETLNRLFFHDMQVTGREVSTVGLDGLVGVVRGSSGQLHTARERAVAVAARLLVEEKQYRDDMGLAAAQSMAILDGLKVALM